MERDECHSDSKLNSHSKSFEIPAAQHIGTTFEKFYYAVLPGTPETISGKDAAKMQQSQESKSVHCSVSAVGSCNANTGASGDRMQRGNRTV